MDSTKLMSILEMNLKMFRELGSNQANVMEEYIDIVNRYNRGEITWFDIPFHIRDMASFQPDWGRSGT